MKNVTLFAALMSLLVLIFSVYFDVKLLIQYNEEGYLDSFSFDWFMTFASWVIILLFYAALAIFFFNLYRKQLKNK